jgi:hypothetical protein
MGNTKSYSVLGEKRKYNMHRLRRSVRALVGTKKSDTTFQRRADRYHAHVYVSRDLWEAISFLAKVNGFSKMETVHQMLEAGISRTLAEAIAESNRREAEMREHNMPPTPTQLVLELIRWAKSKGYTIEKLF